MPDSSWPAQCRSCGTPLHGPYCSACGESHLHGRLELRTLIDQALDGLINLDTRALRTIGDLMIGPAKVCRDYLDGRRVSYVHPFKYALAAFTFAILVAEFLIWRHGGPIDPVDAKVFAFQLRWGMLLHFLMMPLVAAILWPLFASAPRRLRWIEHYVFVLYCFGHVALLQGLVMPLHMDLEVVSALMLSLLPPAFTSWAAVGVYESRWWTTIPRVILAFVLMELAMFGVIKLFIPEMGLSL